MNFFNTFSGKAEEFRPLCEGQVRMYTCGPTVYDYAHIGNFRTFVFEDLLRRVLEFSGLRVTHIMNITDVDDKTIAGAVRGKKPLADFTETYIRAFNEDLKTLNILAPAGQPRATQEILSPQGIIELIAKLVGKGAAYERDGSVYYRVASFPDYGKLSKKKLDQNIEGVRVDVDEYDKEDGADFVLWKKAKDGEPAWDSPWGKGRPGWHIECSAMSMKYLGETFDIHAGGEDLVFPHHENEIAQSEAATGKKPFVKLWLHARHLLVDGEKMSKSKGNFFTLRDLLAKGYDPMAIRYALLSVHYRSPLNFTLEGLKDAGEAVKKMDECYSRCLSLAAYNDAGMGVLSEPDSKRGLGQFLRQTIDKMKDAAGDDLNIAEVLSALWSGVAEINKGIASDMDKESLGSVLDFFKTVDHLLGFDISEVRMVPREILDLLVRRSFVRNHDHFKKDKSLQQESDQLRKKVGEQGWLVKDARPGELSTVKKKRRAWDR